MRGDGPARILAAGFEVFGSSGVGGTSLKRVAERAGVSQALIVHHFDSKDGLRDACDQRVVEVIRTRKQEMVSEGPNLNPLTALTAMEEHRPLVRYLARRLSEGGDRVDALVDEMLADAEEYTADGVSAGMVRPSDDPRGRVVVLLLMSLGVLVLHEHLHRLLGEDLIGEGGPPVRYMRAVLDIYCDGLLEPEAYADLRQTLAEHDASTKSSAGTEPPRKDEER